MGRVIAVFVVLLIAIAILIALIMQMNWGAGGQAGTENVTENIDTPVIAPENTGETDEKPEPESEPSGNTVVKEVYLSKDGVSADQTKWYAPAEFSVFLEYLKKEGVRHIVNNRLATSIERYETAWDETLRESGIDYTERK